MNSIDILQLEFQRCMALHQTNSKRMICDWIAKYTDWKLKVKQRPIHTSSEWLKCQQNCTIFVTLCLSFIYTVSTETSHVVFWVVTIFGIDSSDCSMCRCFKLIVFVNVSTNVCRLNRMEIFHFHFFPNHSTDMFAHRLMWLLSSRSNSTYDFVPLKLLVNIVF